MLPAAAEAPGAVTDPGKLIIIIIIIINHCGRVCTCACTAA